MKILKPVNELITYIAIPHVDLVSDHQERYYKVPKDYRMQENPQDNDPGYAYLHDVESPDIEAYREAINLMSGMYWKILADEAEARYKEFS